MFASVFPVSSAELVRADDGYGSPKPLWWHAHGGGSEDEGASLIQTADGGYAAAGWTKSYGAGGGDAWLVKMNETGVEEWNRTYGGKGFDFAEGVLAADDGGYVLVGATISFGAGNMDVWLIRTDANGNELWNRTYGGAGDDKGMAVCNTTDGGYVITGYWKPGISGWRQLWVIKTDSAGKIDWDVKLGGGYDDEGWSVLERAGGGYAVTGYTSSFGAGCADLWLVALDGNGAEEWNRTIGGAGDDFGNQLIETAGGNLVIAGQTQSFGTVENDFDGKTTVNAWLLKINATGTELWNRTYGDIWYEYGDAVAEADDGGYFLAGSYGSYHGENFDMYIMRVDSEGKESWSKVFGGKDYDFTNAMLRNSGNGIVLAGSIGSAGAGGTDLIILEFDPNMPKPVTNQPPVVTITSPADNSTISGNYKITGTATDDGFYIFIEVRTDNGSWNLISEDANWFIFWNTTRLNNGEHTISARVFDTQQYSEVVTVKVIVDNPAAFDEEPVEDNDTREDDPAWNAFAFIACCSVVILVIIVFLMAITGKRLWKKEQESEEEDYMGGR